MTVEPTDLIQQLRGRAAFCRDRGEVKTPDLLEAAAQQLADAQAAQALVVGKVASMIEGRIVGQTAETRNELKLIVFDLLQGSALADPTGVAALAALRERAEKAEFDSKTAWALLTVANNNTAAVMVQRDALAAKLAAAEARGMERAARIIDDMPQNEGDDFAGRIRAEAAALRGEKEQK